MQLGPNVSITIPEQVCSLVTKGYFQISNSKFRKRTQKSSTRHDWDHTGENSSKTLLCVNIPHKLSSQPAVRAALTAIPHCLLLTPSAPCGSPHPQRLITPATTCPQHTRGCQAISPFILTVGELGPADCFRHPLQFWQRLSASEMKEQRESSSKWSESSKENLSPSSHSANMSSITSNRRHGEKRRKKEAQLLALTGGWTGGFLEYLKCQFRSGPRVTVPGRTEQTLPWSGRSRKPTQTTGWLIKIPENEFLKKV